MKKTIKTVRILHIVGAIAGGGVGEWLLNVMRRLSGKVIFDFLVYRPEPPEVIVEVESHGGRVLWGADPHRPWAFISQLMRLLRKNGPYDIVHSHLFTYSGLVVFVGHLLGVPHRLVHSHTDTSQGNYRKSGIFRASYLSIMKWLIKNYATQGLAVSRDAAEDLFGKQWDIDGRITLLYCGIDLGLYKGPVDSAAIKKELGLPQKALIVGHIGRFVMIKNHKFIIKVVCEIIERKPNTIILFVGDGPLRPKIEEIVNRKGISGHVKFMGLRRDVPRLLQGAMDVVILPSLYEGLPLVLLEAQAAGRVSVYSDSITREVEVIPSLMRRMPLSASAADWAKAIIEAHTKPSPITPEEALQLMAASHFNIEVSAQKLAQIYMGEKTGV